MSLIKPFRGIYYNSSIIRDISRVVCPPYDVISDEEDRFFKKKSPYNFCNILRKDDKHDYKNLADTFREWLNSKILIEDKKPCFYIYEQTFKLNSQVKKRVGLLGLLRIDKEGIIFPHERTFSSPKKDRYYIIKEFKANLSPIFVIVPHKMNILSQTYTICKNKRPLMSFMDATGIKNRIWRIADYEMINQIEKSFSHRHLFIADGHHRFEVARKFMKEMKGKLKDVNYILAYFTDVSHGLVILPTHRIVKLESPFSDLRNTLSRYFVIQPATSKELERALNKHVHKNTVFGMYWNNQIYILRLKNKAILDKIFKEDRIYNNLDVYILHKAILSKIKRLEVTYTHSIEEAVKLQNEAYVSFILRPTPLKNVFDIARKGFRLPHKSTYFYPKILSGVLMRRFGS